MQKLIFTILLGFSSLIGFTRQEDTVKCKYDCEYERWFSPALGYDYYQPKINDSIGNFSGLSIQYMIYSWNESNRRWGPAFQRYYAKGSILKSSNPAIKSVFMYSMGLNLSFESKPCRRALIPYFGLELGGLSQKEFGSTMQFTPTAGIHLYTSEKLNLNVGGGYVYPLKNFEALQGYTASATLNFIFWD